MWARRPTALICSATSSSCDCVRDAMTTSAPASAKASAIAAPSPRPAPVTTATWSSSRNLSRITSASLPLPGDTVTRRCAVRRAAFLKHVLVGVDYAAVSHCDLRSCSREARSASRYFLAAAFLAVFFAGAFLAGAFLAAAFFAGAFLAGPSSPVLSAAWPSPDAAAAATPRLHAGFELGQQIRDVLGLVELLGLCSSVVNASPPSSFASTSSLQLLLVGVLVALRVEVVGHRLDHLAGHLELGGLDRRLPCPASGSRGRGSRRATAACG